MIVRLVKLLEFGNAPKSILIPPHSSLFSHFMPILFGDNGISAGLNVRVDRIETSVRVVSKISWSGLMAGLGPLGSLFIDMFKK